MWEYLCLYYNLYVYAIISMSILQSLSLYYNLNEYTTISMFILQSQWVYYNLYVYTIISMSILQSLCLYNNLNEHTTISKCIIQSQWAYYNPNVDTTISMCTYIYYNLYGQYVLIKLATFQKASVGDRETRQERVLLLDRFGLLGRQNPSCASPGMGGRRGHNNPAKEILITR